MKGIRYVCFLLLFGLPVLALPPGTQVYEPALFAAFGRPLSMAEGTSLELSIPASDRTPEVRIKGAPTSYVFKSCQAHILSDESGRMVAAVIASQTVLDEALLDDLEKLFRDHEAPDEIEVRRSDGNRRLLVYSRKRVEIGTEKRQGEPSATDNPDGAQRLREGH